MIRGVRMREIYQAVTDMGGVVINPTLNDETCGVLIGGTFFGIRVHAVGEECEGCDRLKTVLEGAGGKCLAIDDAVTDVRRALENVVHYSYAQTAANLDATIDMWCEREGVELDQRQSVALVAMLTQGGSTC